jgi:epoxyqueuosine reductase
MATPLELDAATRAWMEETARAAGFDLAGIAALPSGEEAAEEKRRFLEWLAEGRAGEMDWLARSNDAGEPLRSELQAAFPWARSVMVCAVNYNVDAPRSIEPAPAGTGWIGRYAWAGKSADAAEGAAKYPGADYHDVLLTRLRNVESTLTQRFGDALTMRAYVDTGPLVERSYAARAGIGWVGKNTCVLNQQQGSWLLLGVIVMSAGLAPGALPAVAADRCGTCTRCIDACPTDALIAPRQMDASRCISYLTIEKKGSIAEDLRAPMGRQVFGCDICQDVCPWNRRAPVASSAAIGAARAELINPDLDALAALDGAAFNRMFRGSPLERTGRKRLQRNVAIAMGNSGEPRFRARLEEWAHGDDATLAEAAQWALARPTSVH